MPAVHGISVTTDSSIITWLTEESLRSDEIIINFKRISTGTKIHETINITVICICYMIYR